MLGKRNAKRLGKALSLICSARGDGGLDDEQSAQLEAIWESLGHFLLENVEQPKPIVIEQVSFDQKEG